MIKITNKQDDYQPYLACDHCGERLANGDVMLIGMDAAGEPTGKVTMLHQACREYANLPGGHYGVRTVRGLILDLAGNLNTPLQQDAVTKRRERRQRAIIKVAYRAGEKGFTVRDVQRDNGGFDAAELRDHLDDLCNIDVLRAEEIKVGNNRAQTRYYRTSSFVLDLAIVGRTRI